MNLTDVKLQAGYEGSSIGDLVFSWLSVYHDHEWERLRDLMERQLRTTKVLKEFFVWNVSMLKVLYVLVVDV